MKQFVDKYIRKNPNPSASENSSEIKTPEVVAPAEVIPPSNDEETDYFIVDNSGDANKVGIPTMDQNFAVN